MDEIKEKHILLKNKIEELKTHQLLTSNKINDTVSLKIFMEHHIYAVWDFMSILKSLQHQICPSNYPWKRNIYTSNGIARLINEIVLAEESDEITEDKYMSHFDLYLMAMNDIGANTSAIKNIIDLDVVDKNTFQKVDMPESGRNFLSSTFELLSKSKLHITAALFTYGRETTLPDMFINLLNMTKNIKNTHHLKLYLERHIDIDGNRHGPLSLKLYNHFIYNDQNKANEPVDAALTAIEARHKLWSAILGEIEDVSS